MGCAAAGGGAGAVRRALVQGAVVMGRALASTRMMALAMYAAGVMSDVVAGGACGGAHGGGVGGDAESAEQQGDEEDAVEVRM